MLKETFTNIYENLMVDDNNANKHHDEQTVYSKAS